MDFDEDDEVFLSNEIEAELEKDLWSSPLMNYSSPFDDYKDLYADIDKPKSRHSSSRLPVPVDIGRYFCYILKFTMQST
jgi:hypothetical protein